MSKINFNLSQNLSISNVNIEFLWRPFKMMDCIKVPKEKSKHTKHFRSRVNRFSKMIEFWAREKKVAALIFGVCWWFWHFIQRWFSPRTLVCYSIMFTDFKATIEHEWHAITQNHLAALKLLFYCNTLSNHCNIRRMCVCVCASSRQIDSFTLLFACTTSVTISTIKFMMLYILNRTKWERKNTLSSLLLKTKSSNWKCDDKNWETTVCRSKILNGNQTMPNATFDLVRFCLALPI